MEFHSISDLWKERKREWSGTALNLLLHSLDDNSIEAMWRRIWDFTLDRRQKSTFELSAKQKEAVVIDFIQEKCMNVKWPRHIIVAVRRTLGFAVKDADWPSPLASNLVKKFIDMKIKTDTKELRKRRA